MKKLLAPLFLVLASAAVHAQDAPKIPKQLTCEELAPRLTGRTYDPFLMYEVTRNRLQIRVTLFDGQASPVSQEFRPDRVNIEVQGGKITRAFCG